MVAPSTAESFVGGEISRIVIIQSLEECETQTGQILYDAIAGARGSSPISCEWHRAESAAEFREIVASLIHRARTNGLVPALHIECQGDQDVGLNFANNSDLSWEELHAIMVELNLACRFNLILSPSACFGAHFLPKLDVRRTSPCWFIVAPSCPIEAAETMRYFREFYTGVLMNQDLTLATTPIAGMDGGAWYQQGAERWLEFMVSGYIRDYCTLTRNRERATRVWRESGGKKAPKTLDEYKRILVDLNRDMAWGSGFDAFFAIDEIPGNRERFAGVRSRMRRLVKRMRAK